MSHAWIRGAITSFAAYNLNYNGRDTAAYMVEVL